MYRLLLVDDEEHIRNGIKENCDWARFSVTEVVLASNGVEALEKVRKNLPDFLITDLKMPLMDGLTLIKEVSALSPHTLSAILSGYDEFTFARQAMKYNVEDYLLKPCSIEAIHELLESMTRRKKEQEEKRQYLEQMEKAYLDLKHLLSEQAVKDYITDPYVQAEPLSLHGCPDSLYRKELRLLLFHIDENLSGASLCSLMQICRENFSASHTLYLCSIAEEWVIVLTDYYSFQELHRELSAIRETFKNYYPLPVSVSVSEATTLPCLKASYKNLLACSTSRFYTGNDNIITTFDLPDTEFVLSPNSFPLEYLTLAIQSGNKEEALRILSQLEPLLRKSKYNIHQVRAFAIHIYSCLIQLADARHLDSYFCGITKIGASGSLSEIMELLTHTASDLISSREHKALRHKNELTKRILELIEEYLPDERLTLHFIAHEILYVNVDYLGKVFSSETGEKFSSYVTRKRIELAKSLLLQKPIIPVNEAALRCGFGYNSQYFSKVFKKVTGYTPSEYRSKFL